MTSPRVIHECTGHHCRRHVHHSSRKFGYTTCRVCRDRESAQRRKAEREAEREQLSVGTLVGEFVAFALVDNVKRGTFGRPS